MVILVLEDDSKEAALRLAEEFSFQKSSLEPQEYFLVFEQGRLRLKDPRQGNNFFLEIDPAADFENLKRQKINYKKDLLSRAVGFKGEENYLIFDGTMGFGKDDFHFIDLGAQVIGCDHNPVVFALMQNAWQRSPVLQKSMKILFGDSKIEIEKFSEKLDCLYLDPMFENFKKKSKPKKEMAYLREIQSEEEDIKEVLTRALDLKIKRVVVKRPIKGDHLVMKPNNIFAGKLIRYDVYKR